MISSSSIRKVSRQLRVTCKLDSTLAVPGQNVRFPRWKGAQLLGVLHRIEEGEHLAELVHGVRAQALRRVVLVQAAQSFVRKTPHPHVITVALQDTVCQQEDFPDTATAGWQRSMRRAHTARKARQSAIRAHDGKLGLG